jgi:ribonuclease G
MKEFSLPLPWFRRKQTTQERPSESAPPVPAPPVVTVPEAPPAAAGEQTAAAAAAKRRRGSRGGRGRKKPAGSGAGAGETTATTAAPAAEKKTPERKSERRSSSQGSTRSATRRRQPPKRAPLPAAKRELLVSVDVGEQRVAVLEDDRVAEVYLERPERRSIAGNIYLGTVDNVLPGMEAAFVEIGLEKNGFLYVDEIVVPELEGKRHGKKIQDLIARGQELLVQAVKDPMKTKGARLTTEISLPGRFVVFVPQGEGLGVSRRLPDDERTRLKEIIKKLDVSKGGVIVRTAAEGASAEDIERDLVFLQRLWKSIQARAKTAKSPELVYQEAELPLRVVRDLFTGDFERALVDDDRAYKRIVGYLKKTSPHMVERVIRYKEKTPLMEASGVDAEIRSTLSRRVDLPSGGYLIFDYAEAFTVVDVNTGRFVGSRSKTSGARLEDTITKNNLEAVKEVVRQLRLRDIGGIIVIDFIDMASPQNRATVEAALSAELERDRTKTYVVEISPLGLVEMTRQNVTDGPREILTKKCPTCGGDGIVLSERSAAVDAERKLRALAAGSRIQSYKVELSAKVASILIGPGATRLGEIEATTKRRFFITAKEDTHLDHFLVVAEGSVAQLQPKPPLEESAEVELKLVEIDRHDPNAAVGKVGDYEVCVADAAKLVGKKVTVRIERALEQTAYATRLDVPALPPEPLTAEAEAEKPTRAPRVRKAAEGEVIDGEAEEIDELEELEPGEAEAEIEDEEPAEAPNAADAEATAAQKRSRRGTRGGRGRKRPTPAATGAQEPASDEAEAQAGPRIHVPARDLEEVEREPKADVVEPTAEIQADAEPAPEGESDAPAAPPKKKTRRGSRGGRGRTKKAPVAAGNGAAGPEDVEELIELVAADEPEVEVEVEVEAEVEVEVELNGEPAGDGVVTPVKKKTRRGSRGGRGRKRPASATTAAANGEPAPEPDPLESEPEPEPEPVVLMSTSDREPAPAAAEPAGDGDWGYVPMSQWDDEMRSGSTE